MLTRIDAPDRDSADNQEREAEGHPVREPAHSTLVHG
jgi:hypothetical protein